MPEEVDEDRKDEDSTKIKEDFQRKNQRSGKDGSGFTLMQLAARRKRYRQKCAKAYDWDDLVVILMESFTRHESQQNMLTNQESL